ncbi:hypothetical protein [Sorangium sp. So ce1151]|uniref:hypothetical protein n=1 Tax=Sorangium sp. So ce1151 TaxID=3133332 RepID=UPI003F60DC58
MVQRIQEPDVNTKDDILPGDQVKIPEDQLGLVISVESDGYALVLVPGTRRRICYAKGLKAITRMPKDAGEALASTYRLGGLDALEKLRDDGPDEKPSISLRRLLIQEILTT